LRPLSKSDSEIEAARKEASKITEASEEFLLTWEPWQRLKRSQFSKEVIKRFKRRSRREPRTSDITNKRVSDPIQIGDTYYGLKEILRHWVETGMDFSNRVLTPNELLAYVKLD